MFRRMPLITIAVAVASIATACANERPGERENASESTDSSVSAVSVSAQLPDDLRRAMDERSEAVFGVNTEAWDRLTADAFTVVRSDGRLMNKTERLAELRTETPGSVPTAEQEHVQNYGEIVVRRLRAGDVWILEVWVRGQRGWQVTITQLTQAA